MTKPTKLGVLSGGFCWLVACFDCFGCFGYFLVLVLFIALCSLHVSNSDPVGITNLLILNPSIAMCSLHILDVSNSDPVGITNMQNR